MHSKVAVIILAEILLGISSYFLYLLTHNYYDSLAKDSQIRFHYLFYVQIFLAMTFPVYFKLHNFYQTIIWSFIICIVCFSSIFLCESLAHVTVNQEDLDRALLNPTIKGELESIFTDIYYFIYMYSIMGITLTGLFILLLEGAHCFNNFLANSYMNFLEEFQFIDELKGEECSICLQ